MRFKGLLLWITVSVLCFTISACQRSSEETWDDSRTAARHMGNGIRTLAGKGGPSRQIYSMPEEVASASKGSYYDEFIPLQDEDLAGHLSMTEQHIRQPVEEPGQLGSAVPGIEAFRDAEADPYLTGIFQKIHFPYNSDLIKGQEKHETIEAIARYLRENPDAYIFVEGHCDERGTAAYNLALGARRSNAVRNMLIRLGADMDRVFTVSYGLERPLVVGHDESSWWQNRRAQFRVYSQG